MGRILDKLGIYGFSDEDETAVLASLLTGDPILLIGAHGTAKTALGVAIGSAFRELSKKRGDDKHFDFQAYDCSKINFEDIIGIPNPKSLSSGEMDYIATPMTAWGKELLILDEFNRQSPERQNNIFELVRSRRLCGKPTGTKWVIACMNPHGMAGTEVLDEALVDRMSFFIYVKSFQEIDDFAKDTIIHHKGPDDAPALENWTSIKGEFDTSDDSINETLAECGQELTDILEEAGKTYNQLNEEVGEAYGYFIAKFFIALDEEMKSKEKWKVELSGRRAGLVKRALLSFRAIDLALSRRFPTRSCFDLKDCFKNVMRRTIPVGVSQAATSGVPGDALVSMYANIDRLNAFFTAEDPESAITSLDILYELLTTNSIERKLYILLNNIDDEIAKNQIWKEIIESVNRDREDKSFRNRLLVSIVAHIMTIRPDCIPKNMQSHIISVYKDSIDIFKSKSYEFKVTGNLANFHGEILEHIMSFENPFAMLQAKVMWATFASTTGDARITARDVHEQKKEINVMCESLGEMIKDQSIKEPNTSNSIENTANKVEDAREPVPSNSSNPIF
jgi:hypothetical protein